MKLQIEKTVVIKMTPQEAEKLTDALSEMASRSKDAPDWAKNKIDQFHDLIVNNI